VRLRYPTAQGGSPALRESLEAYIHGYLIKAFNGLMPDRPAQTSLDSMIGALFADYHRHHAAFPQANFPWVIEIEGEVMYQSSEHLSLQMVHREYLGGAHPNQWTRYVIFDRGTGRSLTLQDLTQDPAMVQQLAERFFRQQHGLSPDADLNQAGYTFPRGEFLLTDNLGLTEEGLTFHYDAYEIAPYAMGPSTVVVPDSLLETTDWR
jgi:hypothetical protein